MPGNRSERNVRIRGTQNDGRLIRFESWLTGYVDQVAFFIMISGFLVYFYYGTRYYLNPDEALNFFIANHPNPWKTYLISTRYDPAHPPLFVMVLHLFLWLGNSVFALRFLCAAFSLAALWFAFNWMKRTFGPIEALVGFMFLAFSPAMVSIAYELRPYAMLLFFICGSLYFLSLHLERETLWSGIAFTLFIYGAILTHFSAFWMVMALGIYTAFHLLLKKPGRRIAALWGVSQTGAIALYGLLYITQIRRMLNSEYAEFNILGYLKRWYFFPGEEALTSFIGRNSLDFFTYLTGGKWAGIIALVCFLLGVMHILFKGSSEAVYERRRYIAILLVLPFIVGCTGAVFRLMPYGGSRHLSYLLPFASTAIALCLVRVFSLKRMSTALMAGVILIPLWLTGSPPPNAKRTMSNLHMRAALERLNESVPANEIIFVDDMTHYVLAYYLARDQGTITHSKHGAVYEHPMGQYRVVAIRPFSFSPDNFEYDLVSMSRSMDVNAGDFVWVMTVGWCCGAKQLPGFLAKYPRERIKEHWNFGPITLAQISIPLRKG